MYSFPIKGSLYSLNIPSVEVKNKKQCSRTTPKATQTELVNSLKQCSSVSTQTDLSTFERFRKSKHKLIPKANTNDTERPSTFIPCGLPYDKNSDLMSYFLNLRKIVRSDDDYDIVVGHDAVKDCIENAFIQANCLESEINSQLTIQSVLLVGIPGIGKTALMCSTAARVSKLIKSPISVFVISSADLMSKYIGESEKLVQALWDVVESCAPCLLLFDEVDSLMKSRSSEESDHSRRFKNTLLSQMEGVRTRAKVLTIGATNRPDDLDDGFLRRFKRKFILRPPTEKERIEILKKFLTMCSQLQNLNLTDTETRRFIELTAGFTGDDIRTAVTCALTSCLRLKHKDLLLDTKRINNYRNEIECLSSPPKAVMVQMTSKILFKALEEVTPSCSPSALRNLNKWAKSRCRESRYGDHEDLRVSSNIESNTPQTCFGFFNMF